MRLPEDLARALARSAGRLRGFGRGAHWYPEVTSTNDVAAVLAGRGSEEGTLVVADAQSAGRGRQGRAWESPAGAGLYASLLLRPSSREAELVTVAAGVALADGIREAAGFDPHLKWPNDVHVGERKLAGILAEASTGAGGMTHVVLGFGVNLMPAAYPAHVKQRATSIEEELGRPLDRGLLLVSCLAALRFRYSQLQDGQSARVVNAWRAWGRHCFGRRVECRAKEGWVPGVTEDIDDAGALLVRTSTGIVRLIAGELRWM